MNTFRRSRGFTLMEVILSVSVASGVVLAVFSAYQLIEQVRQRQEHAGLVTWEGDLIIHRLRMLAADGFSAPEPQERSGALTLTDGSVVSEADGRLVHADRTGENALSSALVTVGSLSFTDMGTTEHPGLLLVSFELASVATDSRTAYEQLYNVVLYAR